MIRIGIDVQAGKGQVTGLGVFTNNFVKSLSGIPQKEFEFSFLSRKQEGGWNTLRRLWWENGERVRAARRERLQVLHVPAFAPPLFKPCRVVVTVHDLIGMVFQNQLGLPSRLYWGRWLPLTVKNADVFIADSEHTKKDMIRHIGISGEKIRVIYPSGHEGFRPDVGAEKIREVKVGFGIAEKYFMTVGTIEPRKNVLRVISAFREFSKKKRSSRYQLVLTGSREFARGKFYESVKRTGADLDSVVTTGYVGADELNALYCGAEAFLFPSLYEGFGIPVLEAMASGTPVLTARSSSLPEVAGDAAYYVDPARPDDIARGMAELADQEPLRRELAGKGFLRIRKFSWRETALKTMDVYRSMS